MADLQTLLGDAYKEGMTLDEIKQIPMREIVERYGFHPSRSGFIHCPFHQCDKGGSLKVYAKQLKNIFRSMGVYLVDSN